MRNALATSLFALTVILNPAAASADAEPLRIATWNLKHLGWDEADKDVVTIARIVGAFDFVALQEIMDEESVLMLESLVEQVTGERWSSMTSHLVGRGRYQEAYTFMWRESRVEFLEGAVVYTDGRDVFEREPFSARFATDNGEMTFVAANVHLIYGKTKEGRQAEAAALAGYWDWLQREVYPDEPNIMLMGDFNLEPDDPAFGPLARFAQPLVAEATVRTGGTTLGMKDGRYANLYDHIWLDHDATMEIDAVNVLDFPAMLKISHEHAREHVSDHAPVYMLTR